MTSSDDQAVPGPVEWLARNRKRLMDDGAEVSVSDDAKDQPPAVPAVERIGPSEKGWVIECGNPPLYWNGHGARKQDFVPQHDEAIRFARFEDAEKVRGWLLVEFGFALRSVEHVWSKP